MTTRGSSKTKVPKFFWTPVQDVALVECLQQLALDDHWNVDSSFRSGYLQELEKMIEQKLPGCGIKAIPHIESRVKTLKRHALAIQEMITQEVGLRGMT
jgi:hypothetical protein